jgi:hypothetical protein
MAGRVDINGIKAAIKTLLDAKNDVAAQPVDLSNGIVGKRVKKVLKVHPELIPVQSSFYPFVTSYIDEKVVVSEDIAGSQLNSKRKWDVFIDVVGGVWNDNLKTVTEDPADEDISNLMENIELILRSDPTLGGKVLWHKPLGCKYYIVQMQDQTHLRAGILRLQACVFA